MKKFVSLFIVLVVLSACGYFKSAEEKLNEAKAAVEAKNYNAAVVMLKDVAQEDAGLGEARYLLGTIYLQVGDYPSAAKEFSRAFDAGWIKDDIATQWLSALKSGKDFKGLEEALANSNLMALVKEADAVAFQGWLAAGNGNLIEADRLFNKVVRTAPNNYEAVMGKAQILLSQKKVDETIKLLHGVLREKPSDPEALLLLAMVQTEEKLFSEAEANLQKIVAAEPNGMMTSRGLSARIGLIRLLLVSKRADEASTFINQAYKQAPNHPLVAYFKGYEHFRKEEFTQAKELLNKVINSIPSHRQSHLLLGTIHYKEKNFEQASFFLERYLEGDAKNPQARKMLGAAQIQLDRADSALATLAPVLDDADLDILRLAGVASIAAGNTKTGIKYLESAAQEAPGDVDVRMELAKAYLASGEEKGALLELEKTIETGKGGEKAFGMMINLLLKDGDMDAAKVKAQSKALENPGSSFYQNVFGQILALQKNYAEAKSYFEKALSIDPEFWPARVNLIKIFLVNGDKASAEQQFKKLADVDNVTIARLYARYLAQEKRLEDVGSYLESLYENTGNLAYADMLLDLYMRTKAESKYDQLIGKLEKSSNGRALAQYIQGKKRLRSGDSKGAIKSYQALVRENPKSHVGFTELAKALLQNKELDSAEDALERALAIEGYYLPALRMFVNVQIAKKQNAKAELRIDEYINAHKQSHKGYELKADYFMRIRKVQPAIKQLKLAIDHSPNNEELIVKLGKAHLRMNDSPSAIKLIENQLKKKKFQNSYNLNITLSNAYKKAGMDDKSATLLRKLGDTYSDDPVKLNDIAWLLFPFDLDAALKFSEKAYQRLKASAAVNDTYGWILLQKGDKPKGLELLSKANDLAPGFPEIEFHYAVALFENDKKKEAREIFTKLKRLKRNFEGKSSIDSYLK